MWEKTVKSTVDGKRITTSENDGDLTMLKESIIETVGTMKKAEEVLNWYKLVETKLGGKKKFRIRAHPHAKGYQIIMNG